MPTGGLVGRERELAELEERALGHRLVTVVGPGGVGKTVLARAAATRLSAGFPHGVRHVDLTRVADHSSVAGTLAAQLGFDSFDALLSSPNDHPVLLVIDNCEHLLDAAASALVQVLGSCHQSTVLATSRAPLELPGESLVALAPLRVPAVGDDPRGSPAIELFLERCRDAGVVIDEADLPFVVELCRQLDGLPLALEIAAARTRTLSVAEISRRLAQSSDVLERPRFRGDPRHRSVADAIRWSYELLSPQAATTLEQLAVFVGPFSATAARAVAQPARDVEADLEELVSSSLVSADTGGPEARYRLLDTVRRFALDRLGRRGGADLTYARFADHVLARTDAVLAGAAAEWRPNLVSDLVDAFDDIREALRWCIDHDHDGRRALRLCTPLWSIVHQGRADEVVDLMRRVIERFPERGARGAQAAAVLAIAEYVTGHASRSLELAEETIASYRGDDIPAVLLRRVLGQARNALGDREGAIEAFHEGAALGHRIGATAMADELEVARAQVEADTGQVDQALAILDEVLARVEPATSAITASWARTVRAWIHVRVDPPAARVAASAALEEARALGYPIAVVVNLRTIAFAEILLGDHASARRTLGELLLDLRSRGATSNARVLVDVTAALAHEMGHPAGPTLAATARSLPITTLASSHFELVPLPTTSERPIGRHDVIATVGHVLSELEDGSSTGAAPITGRPERQARIGQRGDLVEVEFAGRAVAIRSSKGVNDIVRLVSAAGTEVHCLDLAEVAVEQASTGELIDATARRRYEDRIRELQAEIEQAEDDNDYTRSYRHQVELDALIDHLSAALGRGGRQRRATDSAERARSAVTHRIRAAIRQLDKLHPALGRHLAHSISTGLYCSYRPETPVDWSVESS